MAKQTDNYSLYLEDDNTTNFYEWRNQMNGVNDSNMQKIDTVLASKADATVFLEATLLADSWIGDAAPYTQTVAVEGLTAEHNGNVSVSPSATKVQFYSATEAAITLEAQEDGALILSADGTKPEVDIPITITILG